MTFCAQSQAVAVAEYYQPNMASMLRYVVVVLMSLLAVAACVQRKEAAGM